MLSSCVPATGFETNGAGRLTAADLAPLLEHDRALGLAEVMNFPGVLSGDPDMLEKLSVFSEVVLDGHSPLLRGPALSGYASTGISSDHESSQLEEAREKLAKGLAIWIREGSVAKDLNALIPLLTLATSTSIGFCTDDRNPLDVAAEGHIDHSLRTAIARGVAPEVVYRAASWSVARHYRLPQVGAIAPGYVADFVLLDDAAACAIADVFRHGVPVSELEYREPADVPRMNTVRITLPEASALEGPRGRVHIIDVVTGKIITARHVGSHDDAGVARLSVLERYGNGRPPANGYVSGFGTGLHGAIASSVGHDSHNLIVVGSNARDMRVALAALVDSGGGFCVVADGTVTAQLALPIAGLMSAEDGPHVVAGARALHEAAHAIGCTLGDPFLQLSFLSLPVIPSLKLTDRGLVDVDRFEMIDVVAA
jgi:adenine deaminase